ncbi:MAG: hypothetical protein FJ098_01505, partial [Deltaproteobacteria bacterium]|nr:hypothetical protein [Deltaproteobacteria bacterium]
GSCGDCPPHKPLCAMAFTCAACVPDCEDKVCGDDGCGESCGSCPPGWVCVAGACPPPACTQDLTLFEESFQGCNDGALQVLDDQPEDPVTWQSFKDGAFSPPCGLMLGDPVSGTYDTGDPVSLTLALPAVDVPPGPDPFLVRFAVRMDAEPVVDPLYPYDHDVLYLRAYGEGLPAGGEVLFHSKEFLNSTGGQWRLAAATLSPWGGKTLQLRFEFDTLDSVDNAYAGAALDDLRVGTACPLCALDSDCDDGDPCSTDLCVLFSNQPGWGTCGHLPRPECCIPLDPSFCDDLDPCTLDSCDPLTGDCVHVPAEDCSE